MGGELIEKTFSPVHFKKRNALHFQKGGGVVGKKVKRGPETPVQKREWTNAQINNELDGGEAGDFGGGVEVPRGKCKTISFGKPFLVWVGNPQA